MTRETTVKNCEETENQKFHGLEYIGEEAIQKIQERCQKIRNSSNPLYDAAKIAVYINCLIDLLKEQGFDYKHENSFNQNEPDRFEVTELKSEIENLKEEIDILKEKMEKKEPNMEHLSKFFRSESSNEKLIEKY